jgi:hypothetical protein
LNCAPLPASLLDQTGRCDEVRDMLASIYESFTEASTPPI